MKIKITGCDVCTSRGHSCNIRMFEDAQPTGRPTGTYPELPDSMFCKCKHGRPCADTCFEIQKAIDSAKVKEGERIHELLPNLAEQFEKEMWVVSGGMGLVHLFVEKVQRALTTKEHHAE